MTLASEGKSSGIKGNAQEITPMYVTQIPRTQTKSIMFLGSIFMAVRTFS